MRLGACRDDDNASENRLFRAGFFSAARQQP